MKIKNCSLLITTMLCALFSRTPLADQKASTLKKFGPTDSLISKAATLSEDNAWLVESEKGQVIRLFEVADPSVDDCMVIYRAKLKTEGLTEPAYLEMWCRFPGKGEFFSRGLDNAVTGSNNWASYETPFFLQKGQKPDLIKLNLVTKGAGKVWIKDVELLKGPLPAKARAK